MQVTLTIPDELASRLELLEDELPQILSLGLREWTAENGAAFEGAAELFETLARLPSPQEVLALRPSAQFQERVQALLAKSRTTGLSPEEERQWQRYEYLEHLVRIAKAQAALKLKQP